ncbi:hypothetical protein FHX46_002570 [Amycolatopsis viridis]|uniref:Uncharacterized protein n=1 Tax=Amycolatopsis viridis TaxID=185678 RepID=A0ABX0STQ8_9PSEU|nr:hypothetical protein [Amycolatopsis viridis]
MVPAPRPGTPGAVQSPGNRRYRPVRLVTGSGNERVCYLAWDERGVTVPGGRGAAERADTVSGMVCEACLRERVRVSPR